MTTRCFRRIFSSAPERANPAGESTIHTPTSRTYNWVRHRVGSDPDEFIQTDCLDTNYRTVSISSIRFGRISISVQFFCRLDIFVWSLREPPLRLNGNVYRSVARPTNLYGSERWAVDGKMEQSTGVAEMRMLRRSGVTREGMYESV